ncbi:MAG: serine hydrolase [Candidatus Aminicenantes bacterium]|nr:MAG: serine hydrolase [Candidatus Aminicenantes bacterium]
MWNKFSSGMNIRKFCVYASMVFFLLCAAHLSFAQDVFPAKTWEKIENPDELGYSLEKLEEARKFAEKGKTAAVVIVVNGKILYEWGEVERDFITHSTRKSFLSALFGKYVQNGTIDLDMTMKELGIDDVTPLNEEEKMATIRDCLKARSGVYIDAAAESQGMRNVKPARNSRAPGTYWLYNNWDFNVLGTIFAKFTGKTIFQGIMEDIAIPIQMEHFDSDDDLTFKVKESLHAAYMLKISARDMARFGLLMLRKGKWNGKQLIPVDWVKEITSYCSDAFAYGGDGYGYMWWVVKNNNRLPHFPFVELKEGAYSARGAYGQYILVIPEYDMVIVHRVNSFERGNSVSGSQFGMIVKKILMAGPEKDKKLYEADPNVLESYSGKYKMDESVFVTVSNKGGTLILEKSNRNFPLEVLPVSDTIFYATLANLKVRFMRNQMGVVDRLVITQAGRTEYAERIKE